MGASLTTTTLVCAASPATVGVRHGSSERQRVEATGACAAHRRAGHAACHRQARRSASAHPSLIRHAVHLRAAAAQLHVPALAMLLLLATPVLGVMRTTKRRSRTISAEPRQSGLALVDMHGVYIS